MVFTQKSSTVNKIALLESTQLTTSSDNIDDYGACRRKLGICYVGAIVLCALVALMLEAPSVLFGHTDLSSITWLRNLMLCTGAFELASLPFDLAGFRIERKFGRTAQSFMSYIQVWCEAAFKHGMLLLSSVFFFTFAAKIGGLAGVALSSLMVTIFFIWKQAEIARFLSNVHFEEPSNEMRGTYVQNRTGTVVLVMARSSDYGFTGGIVGLPRRESLVIPANWLKEFSQQELWAEITRRNAAVESGSRTRGIVGAVLFVVCGVTIAAAMTIALYRLPLESSAGIVTTSLVFTLWSFLGLLLLPFLNQRGVIEADQLAVAKGVGRELFSQTIRKVDAKMENESTRSNAVQFVFHPIPTPGRRLSALDGPAAAGAWNIARYSIWLSLVGLGLLGRAVHCNAGRPDLWCMLPAD